MSSTYHLLPGRSTTDALSCRASHRLPCRARTQRSAAHKCERCSCGVVMAYRGRRCCSVHGRLRTAIAVRNAEPLQHHSSARFVPGSQVRLGYYPIPCSIVRHKPITRAALEPNKPHRSDLNVGSIVCTEVASSHIRHILRSAAALGALCDGNSLQCDTQRSTPWFIRSVQNLHRGRLSPATAPTGAFSINTLRNQYTSVNVSTPSPLVARITGHGGDCDQRGRWGTISDSPAKTPRRDRYHPPVRPADGGTAPERPSSGRRPQASPGRPSPAPPPASRLSPRRTSPDR